MKKAMNILGVVATVALVSCVLGVVLMNAVSIVGTTMGTSVTVLV